MQPASNDQALDEAWVYGIIRQESRFMHYAKSGVGAAGLMQVMPATAKWVAGKVGWSNYHHGMLHDLDTNISLGTYYMRYTSDLFNGQETMATAAYNAGPSRAKNGWPMCRWKVRFMRKPYHLVKPATMLRKSWPTRISIHSAWV